MSFAILERFRKDPVGVAGQSALVSFGLEQGNEGGGILKAKGGTTELFSLRGETRIAAVDLNDRYSALAMTVDYKTPAAKIAGQDYMPFYFLPWIRNAIVRTTLRPRSQVTRTGVAKHNINVIPANNKFLINQNDPRSGVLDPNDPDVFITSAVNGCTITVRGSREEPTVYHGNAAAIANFGTQSPLELAIGGREADADGLITLKVDEMKRMLLALEAADPKADRLAGPHTPAVGKILTQSSYQMLTGMGQTAPAHMASANQVVRGVAADAGITKKKSNRIRLVSSQGTVFGIRTAGQWTFYYQKLVQYEFWHDSASWHKKANWEKDRSRPPGFRLVEFSEFWPGGAGFVAP